VLNRGAPAPTPPVGAASLAEVLAEIRGLSDVEAGWLLEELEAGV